MSLTYWSKSLIDLYVTSLVKAIMKRYLLMILDLSLITGVCLFTNFGFVILLVYGLMNMMLIRIYMFKQFHIILGILLSAFALTMLIKV